MTGSNLATVLPYETAAPTGYHHAVQAFAAILQAPPVDAEYVSERMVWYRVFCAALCVVCLLELVSIVL